MVFQKALNQKSKEKTRKLSGRRPLLEAEVARTQHIRTEEHHFDQNDLNDVLDGGNIPVGIPKVRCYCILSSTNVKKIRLSFYVNRTFDLECKWLFI